MIHIVSTTNYSNFPELNQVNMKHVTNYLDIKLEKNEPIGVDTETEGIFNFRNKVLTIQIGDKDDQYFIDCRGIDCSPLKPYLESKKLLKIGQNLKFDYKFLLFSFGIKLENIYDTFLAECILTCGINAPLGLDSLVEKYTDGKLDKSIRSSFSSHNAGLPFSPSQIDYGVKDITYLEEIMNKQMEKVNEFKLNNVVDLENKATLTFADIEYNGMYLDKEEWLRNAESNKEEMVQYAKELDELILKDDRLSKFIAPYIQGNLFTPVEEIRKVSVLWSSPSQVLNVFKTLIPDLESTNEKDIAKYQNEFPIIKKFIDYKKQQKKVTTYGEEFLKYINKSTNRVHTSFWQILETGRVSSGMKSKKTNESYPNMQNIPASDKFLNCFKAEKGSSYVICDYKAQELTLTAEASKEPVWVKTISEGGDLHSEVAAMVFDVLIEQAKDKPDWLRGKSYRDVAKTVNFGLVYGMSEFKLSNTLSIPVNEAKDYIDKYFKALPTLSKFLKLMSAYGVKYNHIRTMHPFGRIRWFNKLDPDHYDYNKDLGEIERKSKNTVIQGSGADITKAALVYIRDEINRRKLPVKVVLTVHDSIVCECEDHFIEQWTKLQEELMIKAGKVVIKDLPVSVDTVVSKVWCK